MGWRKCWPPMDEALERLECHAVPDVVKDTYAEPYYYCDCDKAEKEGVKLNQNTHRSFLHGITARLRRGKARRS